LRNPFQNGANKIEGRPCRGKSQRGEKKIPQTLNTNLKIYMEEGLEESKIEELSSNERYSS